MCSDAIVIEAPETTGAALSSRWRERAARLIALGLGGVFLWAAFWKAVDSSSTDAAFAYMLGEGRHASVASHALVYGEVVLGAALLAGVSLRWTLLVSACVLGGFVAWLAWLAMAGVPIDCGCGLSSSAEDKGVGWLSVARTGAFALAAGAGSVLSQHTMRSQEGGRS